MKKYVSHSLAETQKIAAEWLRTVKDKYKSGDSAVVVGLSGHLGAGKTAFVKAVAKELGVKEEVTSPTFVLMKIYEVGPRHRGGLQISWPRRLIHIDAYRLERKEELEALGFEKLVSDPGNLIMVEWPENVGLDSFGELVRLQFEMDNGQCKISTKTATID
jgi:tRNA threonylcarbamoyladenosine biosynthesis protein TsaE